MKMKTKNKEKQQEKDVDVADAAKYGRACGANSSVGAFESKFTRTVVEINFRLF